MERLADKLSRGLRCLFWPPRRIAGVLVLLALVWRVGRWAAGFPFWGDESFVAVNFLTRGYHDMTVGLDHAQVVSLGFLWLTKALTNTLGDSEQVMRLVPMAAGVLSLLLLWRWAPRALPRRGAYLGVAVFAASYYPVRHANEVKAYAVDLLVALVLTVLAWWAWRQPRDAKRWVVLALGGALGIWFSYPSAFVTSGVLVALLGKVLSERPLRRSIVPWLGGAATAGLFLVNAWWMWRVIGAGQSLANESLRTSGHWSLAFPPGAGDSAAQWLLWPMRLGWWFVDVHAGNMLAYPVGGKNGGSVLTLLCVVAGVIALWRQRHPLLPLLLWPAGMCLLAAAFRLYPYGSSARTTQFLAPAVCLLTGVGGVALVARFMQPRDAVRTLRLIALVLVLLILGGVALDVAQPYKDPSDRNSRDTIVALGQAAEPGERWVLVGSLDDTAWAPNLITWGGSAARIRLYLLREARRHDVDLRFAPDPATLAPAEGRTVLIVYRDNKHGEAAPFPAEQVAAYRAAAEQSLGEPTRVTEHAMGKGAETLWFYTYSAP